VKRSNSRGAKGARRSHVFIRGKEIRWTPVPLRKKAKACTGTKIWASRVREICMHGLKRAEAAGQTVPPLLDWLRFLRFLVHHFFICALSWSICGPASLRVPYAVPSADSGPYALHSFGSSARLIRRTAHGVCLLRGAVDRHLCAFAIGTWKICICHSRAVHAGERGGAYGAGSGAVGRG
jgi:hypothetical protein